MIMNNRGGVFPFVCSLTLLFTFYLVHQIMFIETERLFQYERKESFILSQLRVVGIEDTTQQIKNEKNGTFQYPNGRVKYEVVEEVGSIVRFRLTLITENDTSNAIIITYDQQSEQVVNIVGG
jgi:hypothetical protein